MVLGFQKALKMLVYGKRMKLVFISYREYFIQVVKLKSIVTCL